jgi:cell filamentation protein
MNQQIGSRYNAATGPQAEIEFGSHGRVLRNLQGIKRKIDMDEAEGDALFNVQKLYINRITDETQFTAAMICEMHREWLGELYTWAGEYRTVEMEKGGFRWPPCHLVTNNMMQFETKTLAMHTPCGPKPLADVALSMAIVHAELLLIHPFREGNGRIARWLADIMALQSGYPTPLYIFEGRGSVREKEQYINAVRKGYVMEYQPLAELFEEAMRRFLD